MIQDALQTRLSFSTTVAGAFDEIVGRVKDALQAQGFGILTEIDIQKTLREKIGAEVPPLRILGACNPSLAHRILGTAPDASLLLPCNVVVRERPGGAEVAAVDPRSLLAVLQASDAAGIAEEAAAGLERAIGSLR